MKLTTNFALLALSASSHSQVIDAVTPLVAAKSSPVVITGSSFGAVVGEVRVGGVKAPIAKWTDSKIVAYVPEDSPLGGVDVVVDKSGSVSNSIPITAILRARSTFPVRWTFKTSGSRVQVAPIQGPDLTVYVLDIDGRVYAVRPNGALDWIALTGTTGNGDISVHPDGRIVCGGDNSLACVAPNGQVLWSQTLIPLCHINGGPTVGPDGRIYANYNVNRGANVFDMNGTLLWSDPQTISVFRAMGSTQTISFGAGNWNFVAHDSTSFTYNRTWSYGLDLTLKWMQTKGRNGTRTDSAGNVVFAGGPANHLFSRYRPDGVLSWSYLFQVDQYAYNVPGVSDSGVIYEMTNRGKLHALSPDGQLLWMVQMTPYTLTRQCFANVRPDGQRILGESGDLTTLPATVKLFKPDGSELWAYDLPFVGSKPVTFWSQIRFSRDQNTAYAGCKHDESLIDPESYVYAFATGTKPPLGESRP